MPAVVAIVTILKLPEILGTWRGNQVRTCLLVSEKIGSNFIGLLREIILMGRIGFNFGKCLG